MYSYFVVRDTRPDLLERGRRRASPPAGPPALSALRKRRPRSSALSCRAIPVFSNILLNFEVMRIMNYVFQTTKILCVQSIEMYVVHKAKQIRQDTFYNASS